LTVHPGGAPQLARQQRIDVLGPRGTDDLVERIQSPSDGAHRDVLDGEHTIANLWVDEAKLDCRVEHEASRV
jgi:hypothetical protein